MLTRSRGEHILWVQRDGMSEEEVPVPTGTWKSHPPMFTSLHLNLAEFACGTGLDLAPFTTETQPLPPA